MNGYEVGDVERFEYLGYVLQKDDGFEEDMKHKCEWIMWREISGFVW